MSLIETRICIACNKPIKGRCDKKFCDDYCRNNHNNQLRAKSNYTAYVRTVNNALLKNRKILESILPRDGDAVRANLDKLQRLGFHFKYKTHTYTTKKGKTYFFCYDYGYLPLNNDRYLVVRKKEE